ncbi:hypothetical protein BKA69DRAFT_416759 [Paraphysoderma sedebokerense]|nr:hypothetical protein BKA69DRAFT_416759 [Paraphysoderma sedebokerense]
MHSKLKPSACIGASETCNVGYTGPICATCAAGYFRLNADCVPCRLGIGETLAIAAVIALLGGGLIYLSTIISKRGPALGLFGLFVNFVQTVIVIRGLELPWPVEFQVITDVLSVLNLNLDLASPECFIGDLSQFRFKMRAMLALPGALFAAVTLCGLVFSIDWGKMKTELLHLWQERRYLKGTKSRANLLSQTMLPATQSDFKASTNHVDNNVFVTAIKVANILLSISYLSIAKYSLGLFDCVRELDGKIYLDPDKSLQCYQDWWTEDVPIASFGIVFYVIGIPLYYFAQLLIIGQSNWTNSRMQKIRNLCRKTFGGDSTFREGYQFCILLQLIQKLALLLINMFFTRLLLAQIMSMLVILHVSFVFYWSFRPYAYQSLNYLELAGIACSKIVLLGGIMFHVPPLITEKERKLLSNSIVALVIGYLVAIIGAVVYEYFVIRRKSKSAGK